jgi:copper resistance protein C
MSVSKARASAAGFVVAVGLTFTTIEAWAHTKLVRSDPVPRAVLRRAPVEIRLWFSERLESAFSRVELTDRFGNKVDDQTSHLSPADAKMLTLKLPRLEPGEYTVRYRVLSIDGHVLEASYRFNLKLGEPSR